MPKKKAPLPMKERMRQREEQLRAQIHKEISRDVKDGWEIDVEEHVNCNLISRMLEEFPHDYVDIKKAGKRRRKPSTGRKQQDPGQREDNSPPYHDFIDIDEHGLYNDEDLLAVDRWCSMLRFGMMPQGFALPILHQKSVSDSAPSSVTCAMPCFHEIGETIKLNYNKWVFPGFTVVTDPTTREEKPVYYCSCSPRSVSFRGSSCLSKFLSPEARLDVCDCPCVQVLQQIIDVQGTDIQTLARISQSRIVWEDDGEVMEVREPGFQIGTVDNGCRDVMQYGFSEDKTLGLVVQGQCKTCSGHKACVHERQYNSVHEDAVPEKGMNFQTYHDGLLKGTWGGADPDKFNEGFTQRFNSDRTGFKILGHSQQTFTLDEPTETYEAIRDRPTLLHEKRNLQDPLKDGFEHFPVENDAMLLGVNGVNLHMKVFQYVHTCIH